MDPERPIEERYPAVEPAFEFVMPSFQLLAGRVEATASRIQATMTFAGTITLGFPVLGKATTPEITFWNAPFIGAVSFFVVLMIVGMVARDTGDLMLINPGRLYETSLALSPWEFKKDALFHAGRCFEHNKAVANGKAHLSRFMSILVMLEIGSFLLWIATT